MTARDSIDLHGLHTELARQVDAFVAEHLEHAAADRHLDVAVTLSSPALPGVARDVEPCERCGQPVKVLALLPFLEAFTAEGKVSGPLREQLAAPQWCEVHTRTAFGAGVPAVAVGEVAPGGWEVLAVSGGEVADGWDVHLRWHTPQRCTAARAGEPDAVPWDDGDDDGEIW